LRVIQTEQGKWAIVDEAGQVLSVWETNREAWREFDRLADEPVTAREQLNMNFARRGT
jgi:hypothetical protein